MASPFETEGTFLTQEQADHINERHVFKKEHVKASKFGSQIDLVDLLKDISELTWEENNKDVMIVHEGWNEGHGHFYLFVFKLNEQIGVDLEGFPAKHIAVYYSEKVPGEKWQIISAYPFTWGYYSQFLSSKNRSY